MSTASLVPETRDMELEGDEAVQTLRAVGRRRLAIDAFQRFRAATDSATRAPSASSSRSPCCPR